MKKSKRMMRFEESVFTVMRNKRLELEKRGVDVIDFSIGSPNIPPDMRIRNVLTEAAAEPESYLYAISDLPELIDAVQHWYKTRYHVHLEADEITSVLGSQEGLSHIGLSILDEGDLVLLPDPCYPVFADGTALAGAEIYYMAMKEENQYLIKFEDIPEEIAQRASLMIVSYPNNPTCSIAPDSFYRELIAFAKKYNIIVIHDNAYSELVFDGNCAGSFLSYEGAMDIGVEFNSLSKTYGMAGARVGFCVGNREIIQNFKKLKSNLDFGIFLPVQRAAIEAITGDQSIVSSVRDEYQSRRDVLVDGLNAIGWKSAKPAATMFAWFRIPEPWTSSEQFVMELLERTGVVVTPGSAFGPSGEGYVRFALVHDTKRVEEAIARIEKSGMIQT